MVAPSASKPCFNGEMRVDQELSLLGKAAIEEATAEVLALKVIYQSRTH